jgi:hypothetical protein
MADQRGNWSAILRPFKTCIPEEFLLISDAVNRLAEGVWIGLQRPLPVERVKRAYKKESVVSQIGGRRQDSSSRKRL